MSDAEHRESVQEYVAENRDFLSRVLAHGNREAQGLALAAISHGGTTEDIDEIQRRLDELKAE